MTRHTGTFQAIGSDNETYTVLVYSNDIAAGTLSDPHAVVEGLKELRTSGGLAVNRMGKGEYQVVQTRVSLRSDSPDAP
jgi:hypothetical protein